MPYYTHCTYIQISVHCFPAPTPHTMHEQSSAKIKLFAEKWNPFELHHHSCRKTLFAGAHFCPTVRPKLHLNMKKFWRWQTKKILYTLIQPRTLFYSWNFQTCNLVYTYLRLQVCAFFVAASSFFFSCALGLGLGPGLVLLCFVSVSLCLFPNAFLFEFSYNMHESKWRPFLRRNMLIFNGHTENLCIRFLFALWVCASTYFTV